ncbi:hypothetical protein BEWA_007570 [Theileria equi strain WA]|uniref:Uncharacterized protein n=1 Tax=Theileria equi strain WA TaxID=1537102 RepID=L0B1H2_THEEQ|nr:hypothetical protein BEWA_007570 [Theileria equi strain WA]AFZ81348.1 hypothetical protein BEWA_007570 [Theileria equi strain WA]|eukprot:XP_004831014.1 hypothetical protein BEWA_007570 [Theileria equi strain WA]
MEKGPEPGSLTQQDGLELISVTKDEYNRSKMFIESPDAIMDDSVFYHIKKVISYLYCQDNIELDSNKNLGNKHVGKTTDEFVKKLNRNVLNTLVDGYVGYSWLCEVCACWIDEFTNFNKGSCNSGLKDEKIFHGGTVNIINEALISYLTTKYDTEKMRVYMEDKGNHGSWNPPELYWNLMKSPMVVSQMLKIYRDKPKDEFLSSWYQDYMNNFNSYIKMEKNGLKNEGLSRITSNFSVFTLRISEEIRKFLLKDELLDSIDFDTFGSISPLFWHAENAYIYSQALLHFIYQWRIDLRGCRRLSQLISKATLHPNNDSLNTTSNNEHLLIDWSVSQIHLLMTNFARFPTLHTSFKRLTSVHQTKNSHLNSQDVCDFSEELTRTLSAFDKYGFLLFERQPSEPKLINLNEDKDSTPDEFFDQSVSQYGDTKKRNEYMRLRNAPEMPPLEAIRESNLLNLLIDDFSSKHIILDSYSVKQYTNLLALLTIISPYEMLYFHYEEKICSVIKRMPQREVWQQFYLPNDEDPLEQMENNRDNGVENNFDYESYDSNSDIFDMEPPSVSDDEINIDDQISDSSLPSDNRNSSKSHRSGIHKAWNSNTNSPVTSSDSILSSKDLSQVTAYRMDHITTEKMDDSCDIGKLDDGKHPDYDIESEYMEIKSTLESAIYNNLNEESRLGPSRNISKKRIDEMRDLYSSFRAKFNKLKVVAMNELYQLYFLIRSQEKNRVESEYEMHNFITTNIAASVVIAYITQEVKIKGSINALCNIKILLLKNIANRHPVKRNVIVLLLRDICKCYVSEDIEDGNKKLERLEAIVDLLVYIARFEKQCIPTIAIFDSIMNLVDRSISRTFISNILKYCGPPYSLEFSLVLAKLIENFINLGKNGIYNLKNEKESILIKKFIKPFVHECLMNHYNNSELIRISKGCNVL